MKKNVLEYEPATALFVPDNDPLIFYRRILEIAKINLRKGGKLYFEINEFLSQQMLELGNSFEFRDITLKKDFNQKDRFLLLTN